MLYLDTSAAAWQRVTVEVLSHGAPVYLSSFVPVWERDRDEFAAEREALVLRLAWLRGPGDFEAACDRLNAPRGVHRGPSRPASPLR